MKLLEKHIEFLDKIPEGAWVWEYELPAMGNGITRGTLQSFKNMGILDIKHLVHPKTITDSDATKGFVKVYLKDNGQVPGYFYVKKIVSDYRTRDYEVEALRKKVAALQEQINALENKPEIDTGLTLKKAPISGG